MATVPRRTAPPAATVDPATGRLLPIDASERSARSQQIARTLDEIGRLTDASDTDATWAAVLDGIDETRPHRPLFTGRD